MTKFNPGDLVQIKRTSKSKYKDAIGIIERYCNGSSPNICRVKLWKNCTIQIHDWNLEAYNHKENQMDINYIIDYIIKNYPNSCIAHNYANIPYVELEELENFFYYEKLNWCGCGDPDTAKSTVRDFLWALHVDVDHWEKRKERFLEKFGVDNVYENNLLLCLAYTLDAAELTEHGSSIGGAWLTEEGKMFLWLLEQNEDLKEN